MTQYKKKIVWCFILAVLGSGMMVVLRAQSAGAEQVKPLFANTPNLPVKPVDNLGSRELFFKMTLSVLLVVVLGTAAIYVSKKFLPKISSLSGREVHIVETVHLGSRRAVHLLKIGERKILIGSTNESITKLADITDVVTDLSSRETDDNMRA